MTIPPSPNRSQSPDFHKLDADTFEEMSCAIYQEEAGISIAELYRTKRQKQFGVDIICEQAEGTSKEVASCKCYSIVKKGNIALWSNDFLKHWDGYWKAKDVRKFVLIVASNVNSKEREAEIDIEKNRFNLIGLKYEVWGPRQIQSKIRKHPGIVSQYLGDYWVSQLCGTTLTISTSPPNDSDIVSAAIIAQLSALQKSLSGTINEQLDSAQEEIHQGNTIKVETKLAEIRSGQNWQHLLPEVQARVIRLQASLQLQSGNIDGAETLATEADAICLQKEPRLRALIAYRKFGLEKGLEVLGEPASQDGLHLRISMLLEDGQAEEAVRLLENNPMLVEPHAETERLKAFAWLIQGDRKKAYDTILLAEKLKPSWPSIQRAGAMIRYALALSPVLTSEWFLYPNPVDLDLVRDDNHGRNLLTEALERFENLAEDEPDGERKRIDDTWGVACLCNLRNRLDDAELRCKQILNHDPTHTGSIDWALARGFDFDLEASKCSLHSLLERGDGKFDQVISLTWLYLSEGHVQNASNVLKRYADRFNTPKLHASHAKWVADLAARETYASSQVIDSSLTSASQLSVLLEQANNSKEWSQLEQFFEEMITSKPLPAMTLRTAQSLAFAGRWEVLGKYLDVILQFGTSEAVRLAAYAAFNTKKPDLALKILDENASAFADGKIPYELRTLQINSLAHTGNQLSALRCAESLAAENPEIRYRLLKANLLINTGNIAGSLAIIREAAQSKKLSPQEALRLSHVVALEDKDLARTLWRQSVGNIPKNYSFLAIDIASRIGLTIDTAPLLQQIGELARENSPFVKTIAISDIDKYLGHWQETANKLKESYYIGAIPVHIYCEQSNKNLAKIYCLDAADVYLKQQPLLIRHGGRPSNNRLKSPIEDWRIHLDITGLFIASQLELLDCIEQLPHPLVISPSLPAALIELESNLQRSESSSEVQRILNEDASVDKFSNPIHWLTPMRNRVAQGIENGRYKLLPLSFSHDIDEADEITNNRLLSPLEKCLFDLLNAPQVDGAVFWFDDRNLSGYQNCQGNPIIGIYEVLNALCASKLISDSDRYQALHKLRAANAILIPFKQNELMHIFSQSPVEEGRIVEIPALAAMRKNFASVLLFEEHLKLDESDESLKGKPEEINFLVEQQRLVTQCIISQWKQSGIDGTTRSARASWIWSTLRIDRFNRLPKGITDFSSRYSVLALHIFSLLAGLSQIPNRTAGSVQQQIDSYLEWLDKNVIDVRISNDNDLLQAVVNYLANLQLQIAKEAEKFGSNELEDCKRLIRIQIQQYPKLIEEKLTDNDALRKALGIKTASVVTINDLSFKAEQFWDAVATALAKGHGQVRAIGQRDKQLVFKCASTDKCTIKFNGALKGGFSDPAIGLLSKSVSSRRKVLLSNSNWFDMPLTERKILVEKILSEQSTAERLRLLEENRDASATFNYAKLEEQLRSQERLSFSEFSPPRAKILLKHLRISENNSQSFSERLNNAAADIIDEHGWQLAFLRFAGMPLMIPKPIIDAYFAMAESERESAITSLKTRASTPLQMIQTLYLIGFSTTPSTVELFQTFLDQLLEKWPAMAKAFFSILRWTESSFSNDESWVCLPQPDRLVLIWIHADRLTDIFISQQVILDQVMPRFDAHHQSRPVEQMLRTDAEYESAAIYPPSVDDAALLYFGLNHALQGKSAEELLRADQVEKIIELLMVGEEGNRTLSPWLYLYRGPGPDPMGSFFTKYAAGLLDESSGVSGQNVKQLIDRAIDDLEANPNSPLFWGVAKLFIRMELNQQIRERVSRALTQVKLVDMVKDNEDDIALLLIIGTCAVRFGTNESRDYMLKQLEMVAQYYACKYPGKVPIFASQGESKSLFALRQLVEGAAALSKRSDLSEALGYFGEVLVRVAKAWPGAAPALREVADNTTRQVRIDSAGSLWESSLILRSLQ